MKKAICYFRVSSKEQSDEGFSLEAQRDHLRKYAKEKGLTIVAEFEESESASKPGRPAFGKMLEYIKVSKEHLDLLVEKTDRLHRNDVDASTIRSLLGKYLTVHKVRDGSVLGENASPSDIFVDRISSAQAVFFRDNLSAEVRKGMHQKAAEGFWPSCAPFGYRNVKLHKRNLIEPDESRAPLVQVAFEHMASGNWSLSKLADELFQRGLRSPRSEGRIHKGRLHLILSDPIYYGAFRWKGTLYEGRHTAIISKELFERANTYLTGRRKPNAKTKGFSFTGLITCGECGCQITAERKTKPSGKSYVYYHCTNGKRTCSAASMTYLREESIEHSFRDALAAITVPTEFIELLKADLESSRVYAHETTAGNLRAIEQKLSQLTSRRKKFLIARIDGELSENDANALLVECEREINELNTKHQELSKRLSEGNVAHVVNLLEMAQKVSELFEKMNEFERREIIGLVLSNPTIRERTVRYDYKMPFKLLVGLGSSEKWLAR